MVSGKFRRAVTALGIVALGAPLASPAGAVPLPDLPSPAEVAEAAGLVPAATPVNVRTEPGMPAPVAGETPWFSLRVPPTATQVLSVEAVGGSDAIIRRFEREGAGWHAVGVTMVAKTGPLGIGQDYREGVPRTPAGVYTLNSGFGRLVNPGTQVPYRQLDNRDWWVSDVRSPLYNTHQRCAPGTCPFDESVSEHLVDYSAYDYALVMGVNRVRIPGAGSAFFLHASNGSPTAGCVAVSREDLVQLMRWTDEGTFIALR